MIGFTTISPITAYLDTVEGSFPLAAVSISHYMGMLNTAECTIATGFRVGGAVGRVPRLPRGSDAKVRIVAARGVQDPVSGASLLRTGETLAFQGVVDMDGPSDVSFGSFNAQVVLSGRCKLLDTGTLQSSDVISGSGVDLTKGVGRFSGNEVTITAVPGYERFNPGVIQVDFWRALKDILVAIASTGDQVGGEESAAAQDFKRAVGKLRPNTAALKILEQIQGTLPGLGDTTLAGRMATYLDQEFSSAAYKSFFNRLIELGFIFGYRLIEQPLGIAVVPYSPFVVPESDHRVITPSSCFNMGWIQREVNSYSGQVMMASGPSSATGGAGQPSFVAGAYTRPIEESPLGYVMTQPAPPFFFYPVQGSSQTQRDQTLIADANRINSYARDFCLLNSYRGRSLQLTCPVRFDVGHGTPVKIQYPDLGGGALGPAVYGSVQAVRVTLDATKRIAVSSLEVGYLRSSEQFNAEAQDEHATRHPFWNTVYRGGRLDQAPG